jgi:hypothetical protein
MNAAPLKECKKNKYIHSLRHSARKHPYNRRDELTIWKGEIDYSSQDQGALSGQRLLLMQQLDAGCRSADSGRHSRRIQKQCSFS